MERLELYRRLVEQAYDGIYFVDKQRRIQMWNKAAEKLTGFSQQEVIGHRCSDNILMHVDEQGRCLCLSLCPLAASMQDGRSREALVYLHHKEGHRIPVTVRAAPVHDDQGQIIGGVEIFHDASNWREVRERLEELQKQAVLDPLTGLPNRRYLEQQLEIRFEELRRYGWPFGIMFMDLDHFKQFNDTYGHAGGDQALRMVAEIFKYNARPFDLIGRWGGDEFLGTFRNVDQKGLREVGHRYQNLLCNSYVSLGDDQFQITASIGLALARPEDDLSSLVNRVDRLMYLAKRRGARFGDA